MLSLALCAALPALLEAVQVYRPPSPTSVLLRFTWLITSPCSVTYCPIMCLQRDTLYPLPLQYINKNCISNFGINTELKYSAEISSPNNAARGDKENYTIYKKVLKIIVQRFAKKDGNIFSAAKSMNVRAAAGHLELTA